LAAAGATQAEELLLELDLTGGELRDFIATCSPELAQRLQNIHDGRTQVRKVPYGTKIICEDADGWWLEAHTDAYSGNRDPKYQICDAVVRIENILRTADERSYYQGVVLFKGHTVPFTEKTETLDKGFWDWLRHLLTGKGLGAPTSVTTWTRRLLDISLRFCQPETIYGADVVGWDGERRQFNFPKFAIRLPGEVLDDPACLHTDPNIPGCNLVRPEVLGQQAITVLSARNEETQIFWAMAACVANNVLGPALNFTPRSILLEGDGARAIGPAAAVHLGCIQAEAASTQSFRSTIEQCGNHHWPVVFEFTKAIPWNMLDAWMRKRDRVILKASSPAANVLGVRQRWNIISCHRKLGSMQLICDVANRILPAYILDLCERRLWVPQKNPDETDNLLDDMANWLHRHGGDPEAVRRARKILRVPGRPTVEVYFVELLRYLRQEQRLVLVQAEFDQGKSQIPKIIDGGKEVNQAWIPQRSVIDLVEAAASLPLDLLPVTQALQQRGCLVREGKRNGKMGWLVRADWLDKQLSDLEAQHVE
jgi:hypothetical protein